MSSSDLLDLPHHAGSALHVGTGAPALEERVPVFVRVPGGDATTRYLTPLFPAESEHRYRASGLATIDPLLGGEAANLNGGAAALRGLAGSPDPARRRADVPGMAAPLTRRDIPEGHLSWRQ